MANSKISALTSATTPLAGTETLPIVQSSATKQVSVANLTVGRTVTMGGALVTTTGSTIANITGGASNGSSWYFNTGANTLMAVGDAATITGGAANTTAQIYTGNAIPLSIAVSGAERWSFDASYNLTPKTAAKGINFTANTPAAGMTSQLLNWYEEGTWTPTDGSGAGLSFTYTAAQMRYTRMGRVVMIQGQITYPATASGSTALIGGLPFTSSANNRAGLALGANTFAAAYGLFISVGSPYIEISKVAGSGAQATNANLSGTTFAFSGTYSV